jgi:Caspase domain
MLLRLFFVIAFLCISLNPALAKRVALVMGNSDYTTFSKLPNPVNDARLMEKALREVGFEVTLVLDADQAKMKQAMLDFGRMLRKGVDASIFYYAGHGVQVKGENYLIPTTANIEDEDEVAVQAIDVNDFLQTMQSAKFPFNIVVLDACRNNPLNATRGGGGGLAPVNAPRGSYIAYATSPGAVAFDGEGKNSPYTSALADALSKPGLKLEEVFKLTREKVLDFTDENQVPWETSSITGDFVFRAASEKKSVEPPIFSIAADFDFARSLNTEAAWNLFLQRYGKSNDMRVGVAIQERAKQSLSKEEDEWAEFGDQVFDFAIDGQAGLKLLVYGFTHNGSKLFTLEAKRSKNSINSNTYAVMVVESGLNKRLAQWCVLDLSKKWNLLPKDRPEVALCDDQPFEIRGSYKFTPRTEKRLVANLER